MFRIRVRGFDSNQGKPLTAQRERYFGRSGKGWSCTASVPARANQPQDRQPQALRAALRVNGWSTPSPVAEGPGIDRGQGLGLRVSLVCQGGASCRRDAGVAYFEDCALLTSPIPRDATSSELDDNHVHRLETLDAGLYARLVTGEGVPGRSQAWKTTVDTARKVLQRTSDLRDLSVPPVIREILQALTAAWRCRRNAGQPRGGVLDGERK